MVIRLSKVMGYGLSDVVTDRSGIKDDRINPDSVFLGGKDREEASYTDFLRNRISDPEEAEIEAGLTEMALPDGVDPDNAVTWQGDRGLPNVLVVRPALVFDKWSHYDDPIDHVEYRIFDKNMDMSPEVHELSYSPYPYSGYMDRITGEHSNQKTIYSWRCLAEKHVSDINPPKNSALFLLSVSMGYKSFLDARDRIVPAVPDDVRYLSEWGRLFRNDDVWKQLRPMLYTYWG